MSSELIQMVAVVGLQVLLASGIVGWVIARIKEHRLVKNDMIEAALDKAFMMAVLYAEKRGQKYLEAHGKKPSSGTKLGWATDLVKNALESRGVKVPDSGETATRVAEAWGRLNDADFTATPAADS